MAQNDVLVYKFEELRRCSSKMGDVGSALQNLKEVSDQVRNSVTDYWQGVAYDAFIKRFNNMNNAVDNLNQQVEKSKAILDKAIALEMENEENLKNVTVGRLSTDNIF